MRLTSHSLPKELASNDQIDVENLRYDKIMYIALWLQERLATALKNISNPFKSYLQQLHDDFKMETVRICQ